MKQNSYRQYQSPLTERYASPEMLYNFSAEHRFKTWRQVWIALAEAERELGLPVTAVQIAEMKRFQDKINYQAAAKLESELKHEIMAHIRAYGLQCPKAKAIIHLGATSALVIDNADLIIYKQGLSVIKKKLINVIKVLADFALRYKDTPTMAYTHFQPALPTTVGKRACLWLNDLMLDLKNLEFVEQNLRCLGVKGAVGTQASFLTLFNGNKNKVRKLDRLFTKKIGFKESFEIASQTYSRKVDYQILSVLSGLAQSACKASNDIRLLQGLGEMEEPFSRKQIGSSAMAYKRNPIYTERISSLARFVIALEPTAALTASTQWLERTLDDSANKRLAIPESFLTVDSILGAYFKLAGGLVIYPAIIKKHLESEMPFIATETILMEAVKSGGDRQELHEKIRQHSMVVQERTKQGLANDLIDRLKADRSFQKVKSKLSSLLDPKKYIGLADEQVINFINQEVRPVLNKNRRLLGWQVTLKV
ncbi:MAG: adenylosuccinate lyase [Planctomycetota bacterium]